MRFYFKITFKGKTPTVHACAFFRETRTNHKICIGALCIMAKDKIPTEALGW